MVKAQILAKRKAGPSLQGIGKRRAVRQLKTRGSPINNIVARAPMQSVPASSGPAAVGSIVQKTITTKNGKSYIATYEMVIGQKGTLVKKRIKTPGYVKKSRAANPGIGRGRRYYNTADGATEKFIAHYRRVRDKKGLAAAARAAALDLSRSSKHTQTDVSKYVPGHNDYQGLDTKSNLPFKQRVADFMDVLE